MIGQVIHCARKECDKEFTKTTHNMKFCSQECCKIETNRKIMADYHERRAVLLGKPRSCKSCGNSLSRYNPGKVCEPCKTTQREKNAGEASRLVASVSWL